MTARSWWGCHPGWRPAAVTIRASTLPSSTPRWRRQAVCKARCAISKFVFDRDMLHAATVCNNEKMKPAGLGSCVR